LWQMFYLAYSGLTANQQRSDNSLLGSLQGWGVARGVVTPYPPSN